MPELTRGQALNLAETMLGWEDIGTDADDAVVSRPNSPMVLSAVNVLLGDNAPNIFDLRSSHIDHRRPKCLAFAGLLRSMADALEGDTDNGR